MWSSALSARLFQRLEFGNLVLHMHSKMSSYVNCAHFNEGFCHSVDAIFQLFSYFPCKLDVLVRFVIFKKEYQEGFWILAQAAISRENLFSGPSAVFTNSRYGG